jgi:ABC-type branched-subunit amino acid transport system ATPase component
MKWLATLLLDYFVEKLIPRIRSWVETLIAKAKREKEQEVKIEAVEENIKTKAKRDDKTRKDEKDFLNS